MRMKFYEKLKKGHCDGGNDANNNVYKQTNSKQPTIG